MTGNLSIDGGTFSFGSGSATSTLTSAAGNLGIGTTTPNWPLQVAGTRPSFALTGSNASSNLKHWLLSSMGGNLYIGTSMPLQPLRR